MGDKIHTVPEIADYIGVKRQRVYQILKEKNIPFTRHGKIYIIDNKTFNKYFLNYKKQ